MNLYFKFISYICALTMKKGKVKFYNYPKGYGFIEDEETGQDVFVHMSGIKTSIREGDKVLFDIIEGKKGLNAINVTLMTE